MSVPSLSIVLMGASALVCIGLPIALFLVLRKKYGLKAVPMLVGAAAFFVFALTLESIMHQFVLRPDATGNIELRNSPVLYMLYGGFAAGIFEETARYLSFKLLRKKYNGISTALSYGIGHGGIESVLLAGITMLSNMVVSIMINSGTIGDLLTQQQISELASAPPHLFILGAAERVMAIAIHISLSVIVWYSVEKTDKWWLFPAAIVLHAVIDFVPALSQTGVIENIYIIEAFVLVGTLLTCTAAFFTHRKLAEIPAVE